MARFAVEVVRLTIEPHHNADALEIARIGGYQSIVRKGQFTTGDLAAYIPEQAIVPDALLDEMGLRGRLAGAGGDRVKAIRLRGVLSQGLIYPARSGWAEGQDVTEALGVHKYEPPIPTHMSGQVWSAGLDRCLRYDIENFKKYPEVLVRGEQVIMSEKIHGTWCQVALMPPSMADPEHGRLIVSSKGFAAKGLAFQRGEENATNLYLRAAAHTGLEERLPEVSAPLFVVGEVFGAGVQDLHYGANVRAVGQLGFHVFDVYEGVPGNGRYLNDDELEAFCATHGLDRAPVLYRGPFSAEVMLEHTSGRETISGEGQHVREGVVIRPVVERYDAELGRVQLKSINPKYLLRKGATEFS